MRISTRPPHAAADDLIRSWAGYGLHDLKLNRKDATRIRKNLCALLELDEEAVASKLDAYFNERAVNVFDMIPRGQRAA